MKSLSLQHWQLNRINSVVDENVLKLDSGDGWTTL